MNDYVMFGGEGAFGGQSYYGSYRTRTFANIFPSFGDFEAAYNANPLKIDFNEYLTLEQIYYMLYAHYGNSHIAYSDENQFAFYMWSIMFQHGPRAIRKREIQILSTKLGIDEAKQGGKAIYNHAYNPGTEPSMQSMEELTFINNQNTTNYKKSDLEALAALDAILADDVVDNFIHRFKQLFIQILAPDYPLLYKTEVSN